MDHLTRGRWLEKNWPWAIATAGGAIALVFAAMVAGTHVAAGMLGLS